MNLVATKDLVPPEEIYETIDGLEIKDGWICGEEGCDVCSISEKYIENHCRKDHGNEAVHANAWY